MIIFKNIKYKNFLSTGNYWNEIDFLRNEKTLIFGPVGEGKSSILDALYFSLFNKPYRKIAKGKIVNSITRKDCLVELNLSKNNNEYLIRRGVKPNVFEIFLDGVLINQDAASKDYQKILENILGMSERTFGQVICLGSSNYIPFMKLTTPERREMVEDLLDIQIFSKMNILLKDEISENKKMVSELNGEISVLEREEEVTQSYIKDLKSRSKSEIQELEKKISDSQKEIEDLNDKLNQVNIDINLASESIEDDSKLLSKRLKLSNFESQIQEKMRRFSSELKFYDDNDSCPTCNQELEFSTKQENIDKNKSLLKKNEEGISQIQEEQRKIAEKLKEIELQNKILSEHTEKKRELMSQISILQKNIGNIQEQINVILNSDKDMESYDTRLDKVRKSISLYNDEKIALLSKKSILDVSSMLLKDSGIKSQVIKQYVPIINKLINQYLSTMDFLIQFEIDEEFNETIKSRYRDEFTFFSFSEGEKSQINLAIIFAWRAIAKMRNSAASNLLILDEIADSAANANAIDAFMKILEAQRGQNVFVISHKQEYQEHFENTIEFKKTKNFSRIV